MDAILAESGQHFEPVDFFLDDSCYFQIVTGHNGFSAKCQMICFNFFFMNETSRFTNLKHFVALAFRSRWRKVYVFADIGAAGNPGSDRMFPSSTSGLSASDALRMGRQKRDKLLQARTSSYKLVRKLQLHGLAAVGRSLHRCLLGWAQVTPSKQVLPPSSWR